MEVSYFVSWGSTSHLAEWSGASVDRQEEEGSPGLEAGALTDEADVEPAVVERRGHKMTKHTDTKMSQKLGKEAEMLFRELWLTMEDR